MSILYFCQPIVGLFIGEIDEHTGWSVLPIGSLKYVPANVKMNSFTGGACVALRHMG
ncbi:MAG: hypothetical protein RLZZ397_1109 [Pseudomonadota bacterium]|jgi:hypothetical protein